MSVVMCARACAFTAADIGSVVPVSSQIEDAKFLLAVYIHP